MNIPFVDLKAQYKIIKFEIDAAIKKVIEETSFIGGKFVKEFENQYAEKYEVNHCISVANGTDALFVSLKALGIGPGDEVITVANSWISTSEIISLAGAKVVFIDIEPDFYTINPKKIKEKITSKTKAIIPVHLFGQPAQLDEILKICDEYNLYLIEDCAQSHFAKINEQKVGTFGTAGTFSFFPSKNLGAYGDAGAIISNDGNFANKARMFANHGALKKHCNEFEGTNSRMDGLQAAILSVKLKYIDEWNRKRNEIAEFYSSMLSGIGNIVVPQIRAGCFHVFHLYVIRTKKRDELKKYLQEKGISTGIHYPIALPYLPAYKYLKHKPDDFPFSYSFQNQILSLPIYPEMNEVQKNYVIECTQDFFK